MIKISSKSETYIAVIFIATLILGAFWQLTFMKGFIITDDIFTSDIMNEGFPYRYSLSEALKTGEAPLWISEIYGGFPLLARAEAGICYPINLIFFRLFTPYAALNIVLLLTMITAGISTYFFLREINVSAVAGVTGAVAYSFSGYILSHLKHLSNVNSACWLPLGLFFLERAIARKDNRSLIWFGLIFGIQHLSGHTQVTYYSGVVYLFYFIFRMLHNYQELSGKSKAEDVKNKKRWRRLLTEPRLFIFVGMLILGSLLGAVQLLPTYELVSLSQRSGGVTFEYASNYAYNPNNLLMFIYPYINGDISNATYTGNSIFWEDYGYVGFAIFLMALYTVLRLWKKWHVKFFAVASIISIIFVLGPNTPVYRWAFDFIPGMNYFRFPTRFLMITDMSLIILAGIGISSIAENLKKKKMKSGIKFEYVILVITVIDLLYFQLRQNPIVDAGKWLKPPESVEFIKKDTAQFRIFCVGGNQAHIQTFQRARGWAGNLQPFIDQREYIQPSSNVLYGLQTPNGYANLTPNYIVDVWGDQNRAGVLNQTAAIQGDRFLPTEMFWRLMNMYSVKYITSFWHIRRNNDVDSIGRFGEAYMYRNDNLMPRAYIVGKFVHASNQDHALRILFSNDFDPRSEAIVFEIPQNFMSSDAVNSNVNILEYRRNKVVMDVNTSGAGFLVFSDSYYPGWTAKVDGIDVKIHRTNVTQRGIVVPAGSHKVEFQFNPVLVTYGFWISNIVFGVFAALIIFNRRRRNEK